MRNDRFHGRIGSHGRQCEASGCSEPGEFRAPGVRDSSFDGPGDYRWLCLDHVRAFNAGYDWFAGMTPEQILLAQNPVYGWERSTRAFNPTAGVDQAPRWSDFADPLDAISQRARRARQGAAQQARFSPEERRALDALGLDGAVDRQGLRKRYSELVRRYHPDRNGGDRSFESRLQIVVEAYQVLKGSKAFA